MAHYTDGVPLGDIHFDKILNTVGTHFADGIALAAVDNIALAVGSAVESAFVVEVGKKAVVGTARFAAEPVLVVVDTA